MIFQHILVLGNLQTRPSKLPYMSSVGVWTFFVIISYPSSVRKHVQTSKLSQTRSKVGDLWECPDIRLANQKPPRQKSGHPFSPQTRHAHVWKNI